VIHERGFTVIFIMLGIISQTCCLSSVKHKPMQPYRWMEGSWQSQRKSGTMVESWLTVDDSSMAGRSVLHRPDGSSQLFENVELVYRDNAYRYVVTSPDENGGNRVSFRITSFTDSGFTAENPLHDFPKRIIYRNIPPDSIHASIDGGPGQPGERVEFPFSRKKQKD